MITSLNILYLDSISTYYHAAFQKWIGNQKRKRSEKPPCEAEPQLKRAKAVRGPNGYNLFCGEFFKACKIIIDIGSCINQSIALNDQWHCL